MSSKILLVLCQSDWALRVLIPTTCTLFIAALHKNINFLAELVNLGSSVKEYMIIIMGFILEIMDAVLQILVPYIIETLLVLLLLACCKARVKGLAPSPTHISPSGISLVSRSIYAAESQLCRVTC